jgi:hypothetical protein
MIYCDSRSKIKRQAIGELILYERGSLRDPKLLTTCFSRFKPIVLFDNLLLTTTALWFEIFFILRKAKKWKSAIQKLLYVFVVLFAAVANGLASDISPLSLPLDKYGQYNPPKESVKRNTIGMVVSKKVDFVLQMKNTAGGIRYFAYNSLRPNEKLSFYSPLDAPKDNKIYEGDSRLGKKLDQLDFAEDLQISNFMRSNNQHFQIDVKTEGRDYSLYQSELSEFSPRLNEFIRRLCGDERAETCLHWPKVFTIVSENSSVSFAFIHPIYEKLLRLEREDSSIDELSIDAFSVAAITGNGSISDQSINLDSRGGALSVPWMVTRDMLKQCPYLVSLDEYLHIVDVTLPIFPGTGIFESDLEPTKAKQKVEDALIKLATSTIGRNGALCEYDQWP